MTFILHSPCISYAGFFYAETIKKAMLYAKKRIFAMLFLIDRGFMKRLKLEKTLIKLGCNFFRHGGNHDIWSYENGRKFPFPRHADINERTAKSMIKKASENRDD